MAAQQWFYVVFLVSLSYGVCFSHRVIINKQVEKPEEVNILEALKENNSSSNIDVNVEKYPAFDASSEAGNNTVVSTTRRGTISDSEKWGSSVECCSNNNCESCPKCQSCQSSCDNCQGRQKCESSCQSCNNPGITIPGYNVPIGGLRCTPIDCCPGCDCDATHMHFNPSNYIKKANVNIDVENKVELNGNKVKQDSLQLNNDFEPSSRSESENSNVDEIYATYDNEEHNINWEEKNVAAMPPMTD